MGTASCFPSMMDRAVLMAFHAARLHGSRPTPDVTTDSVASYNERWPHCRQYYYVYHYGLGVAVLTRNNISIVVNTFHMLFISWMNVVNMINGMSWYRRIIGEYHLRILHLASISNTIWFTSTEAGLFFSHMGDAVKQSCPQSSVTSSPTGRWELWNSTDFCLHNLHAWHAAVRRHASQQPLFQLSQHRGWLAAKPHRAMSRNSWLPASSLSVNSSAGVWTYIQNTICIHIFTTNLTLRPHRGLCTWALVKVGMDSIVGASSSQFSF